MQRADPSELVVWSHSGLSTGVEGVATHHAGLYALLLGVTAVLIWRAIQRRRCLPTTLASENSSGPGTASAKATAEVSKKEPGNVADDKQAKPAGNAQFWSDFQRLQDLVKHTDEGIAEKQRSKASDHNTTEDELPERHAHDAKSEPSPSDPSKANQTLQPIDKAIEEALESPAGYPVHPSMTMRRTRHPRSGIPLGFSLHLHASRKMQPEGEDDVLTRVAEVLAHEPELEIELCLDPPEAGDGPPVKEEELLEDGPYSTHVVRSLSSGLAAHLGKVDTPAGALALQDLEQILRVVQVDHLRLAANIVPSSLERPAPLLPVGKVDLFRAGNHVYGSGEQQLATFEIGPWIPVDKHGRFALHKWHVGRIVLVYRPPVRTRIQDPTSKKQQNIVPRLLWDGAFGFTEMMRSSAGSSIILLTPAKDAIERFKKRIAKLHKANSEANPDADERYDLLKRKLFYSIQPRHGGTRSAVFPVWAGEGEPLHEHHPECTCADVGEVSEDDVDSALQPAVPDEPDAEGDVDEEEESVVSISPPKGSKRTVKMADEESASNEPDTIQPMSSVEAPRKGKQKDEGTSSRPRDMGDLPHSRAKHRKHRAAARSPHRQKREVKTGNGHK